ncbi:MAG: RidA family protein [Actinomycetota bacterium]
MVRASSARIQARRKGGAISIEDLLATLGIQLPQAPAPLASYVPVRITGELAFVAGQIAVEDGEVLYPGHLGAEVTVEQGKEAARRCALLTLSALKEALGSLDRVRGIVQMTVFVCSTSGFTEQPQVANGASDVLVEIFGEPGKHARAAIGVAELPRGAPVEVMVVAKID